MFCMAQEPDGQGNVVNPIIPPDPKQGLLNITTNTHRILDAYSDLYEAFEDEVQQEIDVVDEMIADPNMHTDSDQIELFNGFKRAMRDRMHDYRKNVKLVNL